MYPYRFVGRSCVATSEDPLETALDARELVGLGEKGEIRDICGLLEDHGVKLLTLEEPYGGFDGFFGLSVNKDDGGPAVVVNTWKDVSVERRIFTAAHELGHLLLHSGDYLPGGAKKTEETKDLEREREKEREANQFASHFLMPKSAFESEWDKTSGLRLLDRVLKVKRIFRVQLPGSSLSPQ